MLFLKNNWHWILFVIVIFGGIGVLMFTQLNTDTEPKTLYKLPSEETLQNIRDKQDAQKAQEADANRPPPPGETHETGHWDGDNWHRTVPGKTSVELPTAPQSNEPYPDREIPFQKSFGNLPGAWTRLSIEERMNVRVQELNNFGFPPTPSGYSIRLRETNELLRLDENGNPILHKNHEPYFRIVTEIGFAPTREEYERYKEMQHEYSQAHGWGRAAEAERINAELKAFRLSCYREIPDVVSSLTDPPGTTKADADARLTRAIEISKQVLYNEYRKMGFDYLIPEKYR